MGLPLPAFGLDYVIVFVGVHLHLSDRRSDEFGISERVIPHGCRRRQRE
jgi:hypothetical protein